MLGWHHVKQSDVAAAWHGVTAQMFCAAVVHDTWQRVWQVAWHTQHADGSYSAWQLASHAVTWHRPWHAAVQPGHRNMSIRSPTASGDDGYLPGWYRASSTWPISGVAGNAGRSTPTTSPGSIDIP